MQLTLSFSSGRRLARRLLGGRECLWRSFLISGSRYRHVPSAASINQACYLKGNSTLSPFLNKDPPISPITASTANARKKEPKAAIVEIDPELG